MGCQEQQATQAAEEEETEAGMQSWQSCPAAKAAAQTPVSINLPHRCQIPLKQHGRTLIRDLL